MAGYLFNYEEKIWGGETLRLSPVHLRALRLRYALRALKGIKGRVLDVGCGAGDFVEAIKYYRPDLELYGIDISKKTIGIAKKRIKKAKFEVANAEKLPFKDNFFDAVVCFDVIEHVEFPVKALCEAQRVLKPGGLYHAFIPAEGNIYTLEGVLIKFGWRAKEIYGAHPNHYTNSDIKKMFKKAGLRITKTIWGDHVFQQLVEVAYFTVLSIRGKNLDHSVEGYISSSKPSFKLALLRSFKNIIAVASYAESRLFWWAPGIGLHITSYKDG